MERIVKQLPELAIKSLAGGKKKGAYGGLLVRSVLRITGTLVISVTS